MVTRSNRSTTRRDDDLKRLAGGIVRAQGNRFIKELLRAKGIRIGANKDEFESNLNAAIDAGQLTLEDVDEWLASVEGWGNQHVYLYTLGPAVVRHLTAAKLRRRVKAAGLSDLWDAPTVLEFPGEPELVSISFADSVLRLVWHESSPGWVAVPERNYTEQEGLDTFEYRAWRQIEHRAVTRFEARLDRGLAALFVANPIQGQEHEEATAEAKRVIDLLLDLPALESGQVDISAVSRNMDQRNVPNSDVPIPAIKAQKSRLRSGGAYVEFAAMSRDKAYWEEAAVQDVRKSVRAAQLKAFQGTGGVFLFGNAVPGLSRTLRVQLYGKGERIRLWAQMDAEEVWTVLTTLAAFE